MIGNSQRLRQIRGSEVSNRASLQDCNVTESKKKKKKAVFFFLMKELFNYIKGSKEVKDKN